MVVYRECEGKRGREKLMCLVDAILRDYREGVIDRDTAAARLRYLVALNFQHDWVPMPEAYEVVANALSEIGVKPGRRMERELRKAYAYAYA